MSTLAEESIEYIKSHKKEIILKFANPSIFPSVSNPFTIFMAGSPGAGKTEFSHKVKLQAYNYDTSSPIVRIDADEIRKELPQFNGKNSDTVQLAATIGVDKLFDFVQKRKQNAIVDTTFSDQHKALANVKRALKRNRKVGIFYIHLNPEVAWAYTKIRERKEGRSVSKEFFVASYFSAIKVVNKAKKMFGSQVEINFIDKILSDNPDNPIKFTFKINVDIIDLHLSVKYTKDELMKILK